MPKKSSNDNNKKTYKDRLKSKGNVPVSENKAKFHKDWGPEECVAELNRLVAEHPEMVLTRNFVRVNSVMSESTWNRYFGTFQEFKKQAGVTLTRQQHAIERKVGVHASRDHYKTLNERHDWGDNYRRTHKTKWKTILVGSDIHGFLCDPFWLRVFVDTAKRLNPTDICLNGDIFDLAEFSTYYQDPREFDPVGEVKFVHEKLLKPLREANPKANIDLIEGNHELRLIKQSLNSSPALPILLSGLHDMKVREILGLDTFEVNYISGADPRAEGKHEQNREVVGQNKKIYYDTFMACHYPQGKEAGMPGWNGHHHKLKVDSFWNPRYGAYSWYQLGAGHITNASYCDAQLAKWNNGFLIAHVNTNTGTHLMEYVQVTDVACVGGKYYDRKKSEIWDK